MNADNDLRRTALRIAGVVLILLTAGGMAAALIYPDKGKDILLSVVPLISTLLGGLVVWAVGGKKRGQ
jgi:hypothetical protein